MIEKIKEILKSTLTNNESLFQDKAFVKSDEFLNAIETIQISIINKKIPFHYCSNVLFRLKKFFVINFEPQLANLLLKNHFIKNVEFLNGYINFKMSSIFFANMINEIANNNIFPTTGLKADGTKCKVNVEYCSINPTGFLHIGHARNAILGDSIARILDKSCFDVTKEYYVNDAGNQINLLAKSIQTCCFKNNGIDDQLEENCTEYKGLEIKEIAKMISPEDNLDKIKQIAIKYFLDNIKTDLSDLKIHHDIFVSESDIRNSSYIEKAIELLKSKGYIYQGMRENKKAAKGKEEHAQMLLLKTTLLGDDEDRPLTKADGTWTYFAPDIAYHLQKIERGFDYLICVLGADHDSYKRRLKIAVKLLKENIKYEIPIVQMVSFEHDGKHVKFSKREGNAIRTHDFIKEIHPDILRYMMLSKTEGTPFVFDYENACSLSMQNPVFYIQYANARAHSIFRNTQEEQKLNQNAHTFEIEEFQNIIILLDSFKFNLDESAKLLAPHIIANYAYKLAENLHKLWQLGKIDKTLRIIIEDNKIETQTRLLIVKCFLNVLETCLEILAINAPQTMN